MGVLDSATDWYERQQQAAAERRETAVETIAPPDTTRRTAFDAATLYEGEYAGAEDSYDVLEEDSAGRGFFEKVWDFEGSWRGGTDDADLIGPSIGPDTGDGHVDWRNDDDGADFTNPENNAWLRWVINNPGVIVGLVLTGGALYLLRPVLEIAAGVAN